jgi:hypothetical protein
VSEINSHLSFLKSPERSENWNLLLDKVSHKEQELLENYKVVSDSLFIFSTCEENYQDKNIWIGYFFINSVSLKRGFDLVYSNNGDRLVVPMDFSFLLNGDWDHEIRIITPEQFLGMWSDD